MSANGSRARTASWKAMFGGLALLVTGNMAVGISGDDLMVRVGPEGVADDAELSDWVDRGVAFARSLPSKG